MLRLRPPARVPALLAQPVLAGRRVFIRDESYLTLWLVE